MNSKLAGFLLMCLAGSQVSTDSGTTLSPESPPAVVQEVFKEEPVQEQTIALDYEAIAATYPTFPTKTSSQVGYNDSKSWWFRRTDSGLPPSAQNDISILDYDAYYLGDTSRKVIYLTFDEGYEMGFTPQILDTLKENDVKAAFFVTMDFLKSEPDLVKRMAEEGHVVANHSVSHPNFALLSDGEIAAELQDCADYYKKITGQDMAPFFRPPSGNYSIHSLEKTQELGYKTIFWSFAYQDWLTNDQPGKDVAFYNATTYDHNGCIMLLHAVSQSNTEALDDIIKTLQSEGYVFESLYDLPDSQLLLEKLRG